MIFIFYVEEGSFIVYEHLWIFVCSINIWVSV